MSSVFYLFRVPEQVLPVAQAQVVVLPTDDVMCGLSKVIVSPCPVPAGWTRVLAGTAPGGGREEQQQEVRMMPEEEEAWSVQSHLWSCMTLQEPR